jgi:hypothetical protein
LFYFAIITKTEKESILKVYEVPSAEYSRIYAILGHYGCTPRLRRDDEEVLCSIFQVDCTHHQNTNFQPNLECTTN